MTRPLIGITSEMAAAGWGDRVREAVLAPASYAWALQRVGCVPVLLPPAPYGAAGLTARLDAVLFSDGGDVDPRRCGGPPGDRALAPDRADDRAPAPDPARDASEFALMRAAIGAGLPVLAIGRGMRVLNAVRGGSVMEHAGNGAGHSPRSACEVRISPDSRLGRLLGPRMAVPAAGPGGRYQAVDRIGEGLAAVAWTDDEAVAAVELDGHRFAIGMRWHPEDGEDLRIFEELRAAASERAAAA